MFHLNNFGDAKIAPEKARSNKMAMLDDVRRQRDAEINETLGLATKYAVRPYGWDVRVAPG